MTYLLHKLVNNMKKIINNTAGFTLTEVLIGMMILTVAIVSATSILIGMMGTNQNIVNTQKAFYLAQEGVEAVRNIRDTNWLNNVDWLTDFELNGEYVVGLRSAAWDYSNKDYVKDLTRYMTWDLYKYSGENDRLCLMDENGNEFFGLCSLIAGEDAGFSRRVLISPDEGAAIKVTSVVTWEDGADEREFKLDTILTDWKGGVL